MKLRSAAVSLLTLFVISFEASRSPALKSIDEVVVECGQLWSVSPDYFEDFTRTGSGNSTELKELIRCASIWCRWCNVSAHDVVYEVVQNYFNPSPSDQCYLNRTERCLKASLNDLPLTERVERAFVSFLCYYQQYGTLNHSVQYIPSELPQEQQVAIDTLSIHQVSDEVLKDFRVGVFKEGSYECLLRTFLIRSNLYTDREGPNVKRLYNEDGDVNYLSSQTASCIEEARGKFPEDKCELAQTTLKNCLLPVHDNVVSLLRDAAKVLLQKSVY